MNFDFRKNLLNFAWIPNIYLREESIAILEVLNNCPLPLSDIYSNLD